MSVANRPPYFIDGLFPNGLDFELAESTNVSPPSPDSLMGSLIGELTDSDKVVDEAHTYFIEGEKLVFPYRVWGGTGTVDDDAGYRLRSNFLWGSVILSCRNRYGNGRLVATSLENRQFAWERVASKDCGRFIAMMWLYCTGGEADGVEACGYTHSPGGGYESVKTEVVCDLSDEAKMESLLAPSLEDVYQKQTKRRPFFDTSKLLIRLPQIS